MEDKKQLEKFKEAARELEANDDAERFEKRLGKLFKKKPAPVPDESDKSDD